MEKRNIPVSRPSVGMDEIEEIRKVFDSGWLGLGSTVFEFEKKLSEYLGGRDVIAVNTGTTALHIALDALGIADGDEVILPSLTFCASVQVITALRAVPVFCEINPDTLTVDINDVKQRITSRTKAIMPVHYCGQPCDMDALLALGRERNIMIVEDAAHAFGSSYQGKKIGSFGDVACFSFDPIKNITCGEGGAVVLGDDDIAEEIRRKRILGIDKDIYPEIVRTIVPSYNSLSAAKPQVNLRFIRVNAANVVWAKWRKAISSDFKARCEGIQGFAKKLHSFALKTQ